MAETAVSRVPRRLAAILAADIAGYSRLMGEDEAATVRDLKEHQAVVLPLVAQFSGRVIDTAGDGILAEFPSVIHAVECAVEIQCTMAERNRDVPQERRMQFRIGINIGDVLHDEARIYGDGINIAARLENIAEPGGICISSKVREEIGARLPLVFRDMGPQRLKNIAREVHVFSIDLMARVPARVRPSSPDRRVSRTALAGGVAAVIVVLTITFGGDVRIGIARLWNRHDDAFASRPFRSIVVLPIEAGRTSDEQAEARQLTNELTAAARRAFFDGLVISSGLAAKYRGAQDVRAVGRELNVRYVVEARLDPVASGSRLDVQLIDSIDGSQVWTGSHQLGAPGDASEAIARIQNGLRSAVLDVAQREVELLPAKKRTAWNLLFRGLELAPSISNIRKKQELYEEALRLDPEFLDALLSMRFILESRIEDEPEHREELVRRMDEVTLRATKLAPRDPRTWMNRQSAFLFQGNMEAALAANDEALRLDPFKGSTLMWRAIIPMWSGRPAEALPLIDRGMILDPTLKGLEQELRCVAYLNAGRDPDAVAPCEGAAGLHPRWTSYGYAAAAHAGSGNMIRAAYWKSRLMEANPTLTVQRWQSVRYSPRPDARAQMDRWLANLVKAGVPER